MLGAIIGDIAGSKYKEKEINYIKNNHIPRPYEERIKILDKNKKILTKESYLTYDSILICAIYDAVKNGNCEYEKYLKKYEKTYVKEIFDEECHKGDIQRQNFGNEAAVRVSPVGYLFDSFYEVKENSKLSTIPTHNNSESIKASEAISTSIFLMRNGYLKEKIKEYIKDNYYILDYDLDTLQKTNSFSNKVAISVPMAFFVFFESNDFEDSIRKAISIGGDSNSIASIVGALSECYYEIPDELQESVKKYLNEDIYNLLKDEYFNEKIMKMNR